MILWLLLAVSPVYFIERYDIVTYGEIKEFLLETAYYPRLRRSSSILRLSSSGRRILHIFPYTASFSFQKNSRSTRSYSPLSRNLAVIVSFACFGGTYGFG